MRPMRCGWRRGWLSGSSARGAGGVFPIKVDRGRGSDVGCFPIDRFLTDFI
jgi:hypothetical protein